MMEVLVYRHMFDISQGPLPQTNQALGNFTYLTESLVVSTQLKLVKLRQELENRNVSATTTWIIILD